MYAVFSENIYPTNLNLTENPRFQEFQQAHADRSGYKGTVIADMGEGRYLSITLWETEENMHAARVSLGPVVQRLLDPLMTMPSRLLGTGRVVANDLD